MMKKEYVRPTVVFEEIEEQDCIMAMGSNPDIETEVVESPEYEGTEWGDGEDDI